MKKSEKLIFTGIFVLFIILHLFGLGQPYHQDEYKWPIIVNPALTEPGGIPHPPVGEFIYRQAGFLVGYDNFRMVPFFFGLLNLFLLFYLVRNLFGIKPALWSAGIFAFSFYSLLASLMVDTDGAIMPFFFLLMMIGYLKTKEQEFKINNKNWPWLVLLIISLVLGFLVKASFMIGIVALVGDFLISKNIFADKKKFVRYLVYVGLGLITLGLLLFIAQFIFPSFRLEWTLNYWKGFVKFGDRGWFQTFIQFFKALLYSSPFLVFTPLLVDKETFNRGRPFFLFIGAGLFFYLVAFDFSGGALDRYFQFLVLPLSIISGTILARNAAAFKWGDIALPTLLSVVVFIFQFSEHAVPPLHPKSEWVDRILSLKWNFLYPFSGGSGPLGFYISFALIGLFWFIGLVLAITYLKNRSLRSKVAVGLLIIGIFYNLAFVQEYLFGKINGHTPLLVRNAAEFIKNNPDIQKVVVYNDNGGREVMQTGKYEKRLYTSPQFDITQKIETINNFSGHYLEIDVPPIDPKSVYRKYLDSCEKIYQENSRYMNATVYDCRNAPMISI